MKTSGILFVFALTLAPVLHAANSYDEQEARRRAIEKLERYDQEQREAAKQRADEKERRERPPSSAGDQLVQIVFFGGLAATILYFTLIKPFVRTAKNSGEPVQYLTPPPQTYQQRLAQQLREDVQRREQRQAEKRSQPKPAPVPRVSREEKIKTAGIAFTDAINFAMQHGAASPGLEKFCQERWQVAFSISNGQLNITEEELLRIAAIIPVMRETFESSFTAA